ncbi:MAG: DNA polymerase III subunit epsilon [Gammaproteobacteria bacterium]
MRQVILDTETTGLHVEAGHRLIEIGAVEMVNRKLTGQTFHTYICPQRAIDPEAQAIHGITEAFLADKPLFADVSTAFLDFIQNAELIIHNAVFDLGFLEHELQLAGIAKKFHQQHSIIDTWLLAKKKHPSQKNNLDALCKRYNIDNRHRTLHGALLDAELLARVYLKLTGGQTSLFDEGDEIFSPISSTHSVSNTLTVTKADTIHYADSEEMAAHLRYVEMLKQASGGVCYF